MSLKVLVADHDHDLVKLVSDILPIIFNGVEIDQAMEPTSVLDKLDASEKPYNLVIVDLQLGEIKGQDILTAIKDNHPEVADRLLLIVDAAHAESEESSLQGLPYVVKPFSLDDFGEIVQKVCVH